MKVLTFLLCLCLLVNSGCDKFEGSNSEKIKIGKNITVLVPEDESIDSEYLQRILDGEVKKNTLRFDLLDSQELKKIINYMEDNNFALAPGQYTFNQSWSFDNGYFVLNNHEKREIFKFVINN